MSSTQEKTKIVHVIDDLGMGGAQRQLVELLKGASRKRFCIEVISLSTKKDHYASIIHDLDIPILELSQSGKLDLRCFNLLRAAIRHANPLIVQTWLFTADLYGRIGAWMEHVPVIISTVRSVEPDKKRHYVMMDRMLKNITHAFTVNAKANGEVLSSREGVESKMIHTIYNGIDLNVFDHNKVNGAFRERLGFESNTPVIGIVGRLAPVKDHATFIKAAALVTRDIPNARFVIVGNGPLRAELERLAAVKGIAGSISFIEGQSNVADVFASFDIAIVTSQYEGCCNVILEAMAMNKPVIASRVGGNPELVRVNDNGKLFDAGDAVQLSAAILTMIRNPKDAKQMGDRGRQRIESDFTLHRMVHETEKVYESLVKEKVSKQRTAHSTQRTAH